MSERAGTGDPDGLERLWTPYRLTYVSGGDRPEGGYEKPAGCPFCLAPALPDNVDDGFDAFSKLIR